MISMLFQCKNCLPIDPKNIETFLETRQLFFFLPIACCMEVDEGSNQKNRQLAPLDGCACAFEE